MKEISIKELPFNPFELKTKWALIAAEAEGKANAMTISWGGFGIMWNKEVAFVFIRPFRYTKAFVDATERFSISFLESKYRKELNYLGTVSGRDEDKMSKTSLTLAHADTTPYFAEAELVFVVKKLYVQPTVPEAFLDPSLIERWYPEHDHHIMYIAEIERVLVRE